MHIVHPKGLSLANTHGGGLLEPKLHHFAQCKVTLGDHPVERVLQMALTYLIWKGWSNFFGLLSKSRVKACLFRDTRVMLPDPFPRGTNPHETALERVCA